MSGGPVKTPEQLFFVYVLTGVTMLGKHHNSQWPVHPIKMCSFVAKCKLFYKVAMSFYMLTSNLSSC